MTESHRDFIKALIRTWIIDIAITNVVEKVINDVVFKCIDDLNGGIRYGD